MSSDNFNRGDVALNTSGWVAMVGGYLGMQIKSERVWSTQNGQTCGNAYPSAPGADQFSQIKIVTAVGNHFGPILRQYSDASKALVFHSSIGTGSTYLWYFSGGSFTQRGGLGTSPTWAAGDVCKGVAAGQTITLYKNGTLISGHTWTETVVTGDGYGGFGNSGGNVGVNEWDDWAGGAGTAPATASLLPFMMHNHGG